MAKYILPVAVDRFKGSRGGSVFQKTGRVFSIRKRSAPTQKRTAKKQASMNRMGSIQTQYRDLTNTEKSTFPPETVNYPRTNSLGETYEMTGPQLYSSSNNNARIAGTPPITSMPSPVVFPSFSFLDAQAEVISRLSTSVTSPIVVPAGFTLLIDWSQPVPVEISTDSITWRNIFQVQAGTQTDDENWYDQAEQAFGDLSNRIGWIYYQRGTLLSVDTGQRGIPFVIIGNILNV